MKTFFGIACLVLVCGFSASGQTTHNTWINYSKTYYKFKVGPFFYDGGGTMLKAGPVRVSQQALTAAGLGSVAAQNLQLWHNGQEVPIYTSKQTGYLGTSDYIEFWGEIPDGKLDSELYASPSYQLSQYWSLESDSSSYYFTANAAPNKRLVPVNNNPAGATIQPDKSFTYTVGGYYRSQIFQGYGSQVSQDGNAFTYYSSSYANGEGFASRFIYSNALPFTVYNLHVDTTLGGRMTARFNMAGAGLNPRNIYVTINADSLTTFPLNYYNTAKITVSNLDSKVLNSADAFGYVFYNQSGIDGDAAVVSQTELDYPRLFDFSGYPAFEFWLNPSDTGRLIKITDFSSNGSVPVLYDLANGTRYVADVSGDSLLFLLQPSVQQYHLALVRGDSSIATPITMFETRKFTDFSVAANQGNYLIITNPLLYGSGSSNYIQQYQAYRASAAGGSYNAKVISIEDLEDQFAYGVKRHPLAVKGFLQYATSVFSVPPAYVFLVGKGMDYTQYRFGETDPVVYSTALVPTFGYPGSDNLLSSPGYDPVPATPIGRLSAVSPAEVGIYLSKVQQFEAAQNSMSQTPAGKGWMKNVLHLTGGDDPVNGAKWDGYMQGYKNIIVDTLFGANVTSFSKSASPATYGVQVANFDNIFNQGSTIVNFFGHSSATNLDFSLGDPLSFNNTGKYPLFIVNGCLAGNIFNYEPARLSTLSTISEKFVLAPQKGAIGYESTTSYGSDNYLNIFTTQIYQSIANRMYGKGFGQVMQDAVSAGFNVTGPSDFFGRVHAEQYAFQGDPAIVLNSFSKPDYAVFTSGVTVSPSFVSVADDSFTVKIIVYNLGKASDDSVHFTLFRKLPNGDSSVVFTKEFATLKTEDSVTVTLPLIPDRDNVAVNLTASIDDNQTINEITYANNIAQITIPVSTAEIRPIFPFNYAVVATDSITLSASTANPSAPSGQYTMQIDTTALFNSGVVRSFTVTSTGGVVQFINVPLPLNNTAYYWRVAPVGTNQHWDMFSFTHRSGGAAALEQGHYYQHQQSSFNNIVLDSMRNFDFDSTVGNLFVKQGIYPYSATEDGDFSIAINGTIVAESACVGTSVIFNVFNPSSLAPIANPGSLYGSGASCKPGETDNDFEFQTTSPQSRNNAKMFLDSFVQNGYYVVARSIDVGDLAPVWAADSTIYGANNTLYSRLKAQGILIDSYYYARCYIFMFRKNDSANFSPVSVFSQGYYDAITLSENLPVADTLGYVTSPQFGPAKKWNTVNWNGADVNTNNFTLLNIIGVDTGNNKTVLYSIDKSQASQDISAVDAAVYPYIQLQMRTQDSVTTTPYQLQDWGVQYVPVAEGGVAPNIGITIPDTLNVFHPVNTQTDTLQGFVVFKNVSVSSFDSLKIKVILYDSTGNVADSQPVFRTKALVAGDTVKVGFLTNVTSLPQAKYNLFIDVNTGNDQPEQYLFNNTLYKYVFIRREEVFPVKLLDFTAEKDGKVDLLDWKVANEINFSYYGVERSADGRAFGQIGAVNATNSSEATKNYSFTDNNPIDGKNYYRLKMVDKDGLFTYSAVVLVDFGEAFAVSVYPNPFGSILNVSVKGGGTAGNTVSVLDVAGRKMIQQSFTGGALALDVSSLAAGTYVVQVNNGSTVQTFKLQKHAE